MIQKLKYVKTSVETVVTSSGLLIVPDIDDIYKSYTGTKKIFKVDLVPALAEYFDEETIRTARSYLVQIAQGLYDSVTLSKVVNVLLDCDETFKKSINKIFMECPLEETLGEYLVVCLAEPIVRRYNELKAQSAGTDTFLITESNGYCYYSTTSIERDMFKGELIND